MIPIMDMHCDTISEIHNARMRGETISLLNNERHVDLKKMKNAGYLCQNFALFTYLYPWLGEADSENSRLMAKNYETPYDYAIALSDLFDEEMRKNADWIRPVYTARDIQNHHEQGFMSALKTVEEAGIFAGDMNKMEEFYRRGMRMSTLVWNFENELAYPNHCDFKTFTMTPDTEHGLKNFGKEYVERCFDLGVIVDLSHLNDAGIHDVFDLAGTKRPVVASHSNARAITSSPRNLTDDMLHKLGQCGGVTGINFCSSFLNDRNENHSSIEDMVRHIKHIHNVAGIEAVGLGSDFDGITNTVEMKNCGGMQKLAYALEKAGYGLEDIEKIFYKNVMRVYDQVL